MTFKAVEVSNSETQIVVKPLQPDFGAEIWNVDLSRPLPQDDLDMVRSAFIQYKLVFFRNQNISAEQQAAFAQQLGELQEYPVYGSKNHAAMQGLASKYGKANIWHTDLAWLVRPPFAAILRPIVVPDVGGDTMWADTERAYKNLPEDLKEEIDKLELVHESSKIGAHYQSGEERERRLARVRELRKEYPLVAHPIVQTYPETGTQYLYINPALADSIVGLSRKKSKRILDRLEAEVLRPENTLRLKWADDIVAMWDERRTLHYGVDDYGDKERQVERVMVAGTTIPVR